MLAKSPVAGRVKTRLQPTFSGAEAAALAAAAIRDTLDAVGELGPRRTVVAWDGPRVPWLPSSVCVLPQRGTTLDERLEHVFEDVYASEGGPARVLLVGMDTPHLLAADLDVPWSDDDAVLGPSCDGGYWSIGFRRHVPGAIRGVPMSTARTGGDQLVRLERLGLRVGTPAHDARRRRPRGRGSGRGRSARHAVRSPAPAARRVPLLARDAVRRGAVGCPGGDPGGGRQGARGRVPRRGTAGRRCSGDD